MFDNLSEKLQDIISRARGQELTQENMQEALREIRRALLEADVNLRVVKAFISSIKDKAEGENIIQGVDPSQQLIKIVHDELVELLGKEVKPLDLSQKPSLIMMLGLQGSGKTTSSAKLLNSRKMAKTLYLLPVMFIVLLLSHSSKLWAAILVLKYLAYRIPKMLKILFKVQLIMRMKKVIMF